MGCDPPGSSVHGISQARILEWTAISYSGYLSYPGIKHISLAPPALQADSLSLYHLLSPNCMHAIPKWLFISCGNTKNYLLYKSICYIYMEMLFNLEKNLLHASNWHYKGNKWLSNGLYLFKDIYNDKCIRVKKKQQKKHLSLVLI